MGLFVLREIVRDFVRVLRICAVSEMRCQFVWLFEEEFRGGCLGDGIDKQIDTGLV